jgi:hypothetical protein
MALAPICLSYKHQRCHAHHEDILGGGCIAPFILKPGTTLMETSSQLHTLEITLVSTKHRAVCGPRAGQIVFGKEKLYCLLVILKKIIIG